jgi:hypothetical protein
MYIHVNPVCSYVCMYVCVTSIDHGQFQLKLCNAQTQHMYVKKWQVCICKKPNISFTL